MARRRGRQERPASAPVRAPPAPSNFSVLSELNPSGPRSLHCDLALACAMSDHLMKVETLPQRGWTNFETAMDVVEGELGDGPYLFGDWFTAADVMIGSMFIWKRLWGAPPGRPKLEAYVDRLMARPHMKIFK
ncbi:MULTISPECIES: glutathione S-transferase C-terminal domain-containing protein [Sorangium]|nr:MULTISPECIES: glutathione S-transferase C-terminal domain-containing protein [Sorangium]